LEVAKKYVQAVSYEGQPVQTSAMMASRTLAEMDLLRIPEWKWGSLFMWGGFTWLRDVRFLPDPENPQFMRRSSWLYPDDGCFTRAALMVKNLGASGYGDTIKLFVFGNLTVKSPNAIGGQVSWWYHVVPAFKVLGTENQGQLIYVFDPAIEPKYPILLQSWLLSMGVDQAGMAQLKVSVCHKNTYVPMDDCINGTQGVEERSLQDQAGFLRYERQRLLDLGRNPDLELAEFPPWK
jgi:hypothetical protein